MVNQPPRTVIPPNISANPHHRCPSSEEKVPKRIDQQWSIAPGELARTHQPGTPCPPNKKRRLRSLNKRRFNGGGGNRTRDAEADDPVAQLLAAALTERGFVVDRSVGQSHFRCDLAVRREGDEAYRLGILLDNRAYYEQSDLLERDMMRPKPNVTAND